MTFRPARRFLGLPACLWLLAPPLLVAAAYWAGPPQGLAPPEDPQDLLRPIVLAARDGNTFRFVPFDNSGEISPLWAVTFTIGTTHRSDWRLAWGDRPAFGFWDRSGRWTYALTAHRFDKDWKSDDPLTLPDADLARLRPLVIAELDRRAPDEHRGERLTRILGQGLERQTRLCWQNAVILAAWVSLPIALMSIVSMFVRPRPAAQRQPVAQRVS